MKTLYFSGAETFPQFSAGHRNLSWYRFPPKLPAAREAIHVSTGSHVTSGQHLVSLLWKHSCAFLLMVLFLRSIITDWQDENKRTKKLDSQVWENLCSLYSNKCLRLASEKFVLASGSNLSLATRLASWKVSLEPCWQIGVLYLSEHPEIFIESNTENFWKGYVTNVSQQGTWCIFSLFKLLQRK